MLLLRKAKKSKNKKKNKKNKKTQKSCQPVMFGLNVQITESNVLSTK